MSDFYSQLSAPMPEASLSADTSRGFELTSIKAAFVWERLNTVFGLCGTGWRYSHSSEVVVNNEVVVQVALQYRVPENGVGAVEWYENMWVYNDDKSWSYPVYAFGGKTPMGRATAQTDARKSALTDGLTKAASMIGVGQEVFKGEKTSSPSSPKQAVRKSPPKQSSAPAKESEESSSSPEVDSTAFYKYARKTFGTSLPSEVTVEAQKVRNSESTWEQALENIKKIKV